MFLCTILKCKDKWTHKRTKKMEQCNKDYEKYLQKTVLNIYVAKKVQFRTNKVFEPSRTRKILNAYN